MANNKELKLKLEAKLILDGKKADLYFPGLGATKSNLNLAFC